MEEKIRKESIEDFTARYRKGVDLLMKYLPWLEEKSGEDTAQRCQKGTLPFPQSPERPAKGCFPGFTGGKEKGGRLGGGISLGVFKEASGGKRKGSRSFKGFSDCAGRGIQRLRKNQG